MKQRKIILYALCIFYGIAAVGCLLYHTSVSSPNAAESASAQPTVATEISTETDASEANLSETELTETDSSDSQEALLSDSKASETDVQEASEETAGLQTEDSENTESAFTPIPFTCKSKPSLNVRDIPSTEGKVVAKIKFGASGEITELVDDEWAAVSCQGITGYCAIRYLEYGSDSQETDADVIQADSAATPSTDDGQPEVSSSPSGEGQTEIQSANSSGTIVIRKGCYVRSESNSHSSESILLTAKAGDSFPHIPKMDTPYFYAVQLPDQTIAYVSVGYSAVEND